MDYLLLYLIIEEELKSLDILKDLDTKFIWSMKILIQKFEGNRVAVQIHVITSC